MPWEAQSSRIRAYSYLCRKERASIDLPGSSYLLTLASILITFVSVSTVAFIFRQALGPGLSEVENQLIRGFIRTGLVRPGLPCCRRCWDCSASRPP